jgi:hypothetical protein
MPTMVKVRPASKPALFVGRFISGLVVLFLLFDGTAKLVSWPVVSETMNKMGYGPSETLARSVGIITILCTVLYSVPPTSILGAILFTGYLGSAAASHVRIGTPQLTHILFGVYPGLMAWGCLWLGDGRVGTTLPLRR